MSNRSMFIHCVGFGALITMSACTTQIEDVAQTRESQVIYGNDDREDYYAHPDESLRELTRLSIVSMMDMREMDMSDPDDIGVATGNLGRDFQLCDDERFYDQPTASDCSATLIDDDLVLTAGHCMQTQGRCDQVAFVFNYYYAEEGRLETVTSADVFPCVELVVQELSSGNTELDYAIARIDRSAVPDHQPAPMSLSTNSLSEGDGVTIIGFPSGIPAKIDDGGHVVDARENSRDYFNATTDSFGGSSGSGVFDTNNELIGILVRGDQDYAWNGRCTTVNELPDEGGSFGGEAITYAARAIEELCASGYPSERLCDIEVVCGDGFCSTGEDFDSCSADCDLGSNIPSDWRCEDEWYAAGDGCDCRCGAYDPDCSDAGQELFRCGDNDDYCTVEGLCASTEPVDEVPDEWTCDAEFYGGGDGCDCECGAYDIDCDNPSQEVFNCDFGEACIDPGVCFGEGGDDVGPDTGDDVGTVDTGESDAGDDTTANGDVIDSDTGGTDDDRTGTSTCSTTGGNGATPALALLGMLAIGRRRRRK